MSTFSIPTLGYRGLYGLGRTMGEPKGTAPDVPPVGQQAGGRKSDNEGASAAYGYGDVLGYGPRPANTYATFWKALRDPTLALARALALNPILAGSWSVKSKEDAPKERVELIKETILPQRVRIVEDLLWAVDMGWAGSEVVWEVVAGKYVVDYTRLVPHRDSEDQILTDAAGRFVGLRDRKDEKADAVELLGPKAFAYTYGRYGQNWYGRSRLENVLDAIWNWRETNDRSAKLGKKASGIVMGVGHPPGAGKDTAGNPASYQTLADGVGKMVVGNVNGYFTYETLAGLVTPEKLKTMTADQIATLLKMSVWQFNPVDLGDPSGSITALVEDKVYLDKLKCRGYLVPERAVLEGQFGTKAEAGAHANVAIMTSELVDRGIARAVSEGPVDSTLAINWGDDAKGTVWIEAEPLEDTQRRSTTTSWNGSSPSPRWPATCTSVTTLTR